MKILFIVPYPVRAAPSQRFRFEQYFGVLKGAGHTFEVHPFLDDRGYQIFSQQGSPGIKAGVLIRGFFRRLTLLVRVRQFDRIFIHREAMPVGPPLIEWIITHLLGRQIIFDFDDAIWLTDRPGENRIFRAAKWRSKVGSICRWSRTVSAGNEYLFSYARQFNTHVVYNPSTIDTEVFVPGAEETHSEFVIGWTGSHSTLKYLLSLEDVLREVGQLFPAVQFLVIADRPPSLSLKSVRFVQWSRQSEVADLQKIDIGIMPLPDDEWTRGKCGFKALQYMSLGKPALASPVGVNSVIVQHGVNGFLCDSPADWLKYILYLMENPGVRIQMGQHGRKTVIDRYSIASNAPTFLSLFEY